MNINVRAELVAIDSIEAHPSNPRLGDVAAIAESLEINGQYSPVVVWGKTIIAGTHTWKAAKSLGWKEIAVTHFEGTEDDALRVLITDNRTSDIATYSNELLLDLLRGLPTLEGTGYDTEFLDELDGLYKDDGGGVSPKPLVDEAVSDEPKPIIKLGSAFYGELDPTLYEIWVASLKEAVGDKKAKIVQEIRDRLDIPKEAKPKAKEAKKVKPSNSELPKLSMNDTTLVPLSELRRFPSNPREGDIGAISESLRVLGQYRPIVVNKRNNQILKGNHTAAAASALGWKEIAVAFVDVDDEQATRIVLADNRTADKATYDNDLLVSAVSRLENLEGSGFDSEDLVDIAKGKDSTPNSAKVKFQIGEYKFSTVENIYTTWLEEVSLPNEALHALGLPLSALVREGSD
jgi:ParB-like chromosome segregation protein Spo0J